MRTCSGSGRSQTARRRAAPSSRPRRARSAAPPRGASSAATGRRPHARASGRRRPRSSRLAGRSRSCRRSPRPPGRRASWGPRSTRPRACTWRPRSPATSVVEPPPSATSEPSRPIPKPRPQPLEDRRSSSPARPAGTSCSATSRAPSADLGADPVDARDVGVGDELDGPVAGNEVRRARRSPRARHGLPRPRAGRRRRRLPGRRRRPRRRASGSR